MRRLEEEIAEYIVELGSGPARVAAQKVRGRLAAMLRFPRRDHPMDTDRGLNDPLGLWGRTPGWRCWMGRHAECEPLGADEACTCRCGLGLQHGLDQSGVPTKGCTCGQEGKGERWHDPQCPWRRTWAYTVERAALEVAEEEGKDA